MWTIYLKELLELLRDRKSLIFMLVIPILAMPVISGGFAWFASVMTKNAMQAELTYAIFGKENGPLLTQRLAQTEGFREVPVAGTGAIKTAISDERIQFALEIPPDFLPALAAHRQTALILHYNTASAGSIDVIGRRVNAVLDAERKKARHDALPSLNLSQEKLDFALNPIRVETRSTADKREQLGAIVGTLLPFVLLMVCLSAAMYPAIDLGAGEKERGTLETLLLAPVGRGAMVLAKFGVLFTAGLTSAILMVASIGLLLALFGNAIDPDLAQIVRSIGVGGLAMLALMLVPTSAIFAAVLLSISIYAKSYKEAQGFIQPLMLLMILPVTLSSVPGVRLSWFWAMVPLTNVALAMKELLKGTMDYSMFWVILFSTTLIAGALLAWCRWWFTQERVLFRN